MASEVHSTSDYITHHLQNLQVCRVEQQWVWNDCAGNFWTLNVDSMFFSVLLGALFVFGFQPGRQEGDQRYAGPLAGVYRNARGVHRYQRERNLSQKEQPHRAACPDDFRLGVSHEPHGPDPRGLPAAARGPRGRALSQGRADHRRQCHLRHVDIRILPDHHLYRSPTRASVALFAN